MDFPLKRILLKLSGEALQGREGHGIDAETLGEVARPVQEALSRGIEVALVLGAGNFFRGAAGSRRSLKRTTGDSIGMLGTVMNALAMRDALGSLGVNAAVQSAIPMPGIVKPFNLPDAEKLLESGKVVIFAGGTGHPYFTTDTTAALRACQIGAEAILKATKVNGVYSDDPVETPDAVRYETISYSEALEKRLRIMDSTAFSLCMDNSVPIVVFNFNEEKALERVTGGDLASATLITGRGAA